MMFQKYYNQMLQHVVEWNRKASNQPSQFLGPRTDQIILQRKLFVEELQELLDAIKDDDKTEMMDAVADIFVVGSYLSVLLSFPINYKEFEEFDICDCGASLKFFPSYSIDNNDQTIVEYVEELIKSVDHIDAEFLNTACQLLIVWIGFKLGNDYAVLQCLSNVLESNDTKFGTTTVIDGEYLKDDIEKELEYVTEKYKGQYSDIEAVFVPSTLFTEQVYYSLRADNGKGKILKPSFFKEPTITEIIDSFLEKGIVCWGNVEQPGWNCDSDVSK